MKNSTKSLIMLGIAINISLTGCKSGDLIIGDNEKIGEQPIKIEVSETKDSKEYELKSEDQIKIQNEVFAKTDLSKKDIKISLKDTLANKRANNNERFLVILASDLSEKSKKYDIEEMAKIVNIAMKKETTLNFQTGEYVGVNGTGNSDSYGEGIKTKKQKNERMIILGIVEGRKNEYLLGDVYSQTITGWYKERDLNHIKHKIVKPISWKKDKNGKTSYYIPKGWTMQERHMYNIYPQYDSGMTEKEINKHYGISQKDLKQARTRRK